MIEVNKNIPPNDVMPEYVGWTVWKVTHRWGADQPEVCELCLFNPESAKIGVRQRATVTLGREQTEKLHRAFDIQELIELQREAWQITRRLYPKNGPYVP